MTWREMLKYWWTGEHPDDEEKRRKTNALMSTAYLMTREALVSDKEGKREEAKALRAATRMIEKLIEKMETAELEKECK